MLIRDKYSLKLRKNNNRILLYRRCCFDCNSQLYNCNINFLNKDLEHKYLYLPDCKLRSAAKYLDYNPSK